jgi:predicted permease
MIVALWHDVVLAARRLLRTPGFTCVAVATLALGIGVNLAIFTCVNGVLLKPVPVPIGHRLVGISATERGAIVNGSLSASTFQVLRDRPLQNLAGITWTQQFTGAFSAGEASRVVLAEAVAGNYFQLMGVLPRTGRLLQPFDDAPAAAPAVVISERLWRQQFNATPTLLGTPVRLAGLPAVIVGVVPDTFRGLTYPNLLGVEVWIATHAADPVLPKPKWGSYAPGRVFGRLKEGVRFGQADAEIRAVTVGSDPTDATMGAGLVPSARAVLPPQAMALGALAGTAFVGLSGLVLVAACINLSNLWFVRLQQRAGDLAMRLALGAEGRHLRRMVVTEAMLVTVAGAFGGLWLGRETMRVFDVRLVPEMGGLAVHPDLSPDWHVLVFAGLVSLATMAAVTAVVLSRISRIEPLSLLRGGAPDGHRSRSFSFQTVAVASQLTAAVVVLVAAGLFARSFLATQGYEPGFPTAHRAVAQIALSRSPRNSDEAVRAALTQLLDSAARTPGVDAAALTSGLPAGRPSRLARVRDEGQVVGLMTSGVGCRLLSVSPGFFGVLALQVRGRDFAVTDADSARSVVIVSEGVAAGLWPHRVALGRRLSWVDDRSERRSLEVIGVVPDADPAAVDPDARRACYVPLAQQPSPRVALVARSDHSAGSLATALRTVAAAVPDVALYDVRSLADHLGLAAAGLRLAAISLGALGILVLIIAGAGLYGVMSGMVAARTREFGIRRALGASTGELYALVAHDSLRVQAMGIIPGLVLAWLVIRTLRHFLLGVSPSDPLTLVLVPAGLFAIGLGAALKAGRRAIQVPPTVALRE